MTIFQGCRVALCLSVQLEFGSGGVGKREFSHSVQQKTETIFSDRAGDSASPNRAELDGCWTPRSTRRRWEWEKCTRVTIM